MSYPIGTRLIDKEDGDEWIKIGIDEYLCEKGGNRWVRGEVYNMSETYHWVVVFAKEDSFSKLYKRLK